jgi:DNA helicase HerA-like ATPase
MEDAAFKMMARVASKARKDAASSTPPEPAQEEAPAAQSPASANPVGQAVSQGLQDAGAEEVSLESRIEAAFQAADHEVSSAVADSTPAGGQEVPAAPQQEAPDISQARIEAAFRQSAAAAPAEQFSAAPQEADSGPMDGDGPFQVAQEMTFEDEVEVAFEPDDDDYDDDPAEYHNQFAVADEIAEPLETESIAQAPAAVVEAQAPAAGEEPDPFMAGVEAAFKAGAEAAFKKGAMAAFVADDDEEEELVAEDDGAPQPTTPASPASQATLGSMTSTSLQTEQGEAEMVAKAPVPTPAAPTPAAPTPAAATPAAATSAPTPKKSISFEDMGRNAIKAAQEDLAQAYEEVAVDNTKSLKGGYVISVAGSKIAGILVPNDGTEGDTKRATEAMQIGALIKVCTPRSIAYGVVSSLSSSEPSSPPQPGEKRILEIDLFGEEMLSPDGGSSSFQRGVSVYPALGEAIYSTTHDELAKIYARPEVPNVCIGTLQQDRSLPAHLMVDELLGKHFAILGTTGSGKSCTLAVIMRSILEPHPAGHVVLLDPHNEYGRAFGDRAMAINPSTLKLPYWLLNFEEMVEVLCSPEKGSRQAEAYILKDAITLAKRESLDDPGSAEWLTVDTPLPYALGALMQKIELAMGQMEKAEQNTPYLRLRARLENLRSDRRYDFMFGGFSVQDNMADVLSQIMRIPADGKPVTIFDLSGVPSEIVDVVVSLLCRTIFDFAVWSERNSAVPVLLICEEAHRYVPQDSSIGFAPTRKVISQIAKEGRKYGVSLGLVTQRPSELSETILSQCNTLFALRMSNTKDQEFVRRALPDSASGLLSALPALRNQEAVVVGEGVSLPMRVCFNDLADAQRPHSDTASFSAAWQEDYADEVFIAETIDRWRRQSR